VIGRTFFYQVLRSLTGMDGKLDRRLSELEHHELIRKKHLAAELEYIFRHALTQEAIYGSILFQRRRELHARVGMCIESLFADRLDEFYAVLADHYARAEDWEKAQDYLFKAGDRAGNLAADAEALAHYRQALSAYERAFGERWDPLERAILERKMGEALFRRGEHEQAREQLQRALADLGHPYPQLRRRIRLALLSQLLRQAGHRWLPRLFLRRRPDDDVARVQELARLYETMGWIDILLDQERHLLDGLFLANSSERHGFPQGIAAGATGLGFAFDHAPLFGLAERYHRRAVALAEEIQHPAGLGFSNLGLGFHEHRVGRFASAREHYQRSMDAYLRAGELRKWAAAARLLATIQLQQGQLRDGLELGWQIARTGEDAGDHQSAAWGLSQVGECLWRGGAPDQAIEHFQHAIEVLEAVPDYSQLAVASADLAQSYMGQGRLDVALERLEETNRLIAQRGVRGFGATEARNATAEAYLRAAERAEGAERNSFLKKAKRACKAARKQAKLDRQGFPAAYRLQGRLFWLQRKPEKAKRWWQRSLEAAEKLGAVYELALTSLEAGQRTGDRTQELRGEALLDEMRAQVDLSSQLRPEAAFARAPLR
jgi:tetratricopeptide (TPR) repeat protein